MQIFSKMILMFSRSGEKAWDMEFNPSKCQVLHISRSRKPIKHSYTMHGQVLDSIDHARYLGVDISSDLNFNHHINRVTSNASKRLGFLKRSPDRTSAHSGPVQCGSTGA